MVCHVYLVVNSTYACYEFAHVVLVVCHECGHTLVHTTTPHVIKKIHVELQKLHMPHFILLLV